MVKVYRKSCHCTAYQKKVDHVVWLFGLIRCRRSKFALRCEACGKISKTSMSKKKLDTLESYERGLDKNVCGK